MNKGLYVEFNGVAGSGKSTICNALIIALEKKCFPVLRYQKLYESFCASRFWKAKLVWLSLDIDNIRLIIETIKLVHLLGLKHVNKKVVRFFLINQILIKWFSKRFSDYYLISDEGYVQYLISIIYNNSISINCDMKVINSFFTRIQKSMDCLCVNVILNTSENANRVIKRKDGKSRLDTLNKENLNKIIMTQASNFNAIRKHINSKNQIDVDSENNVDLNVDLILYEILKRKGK